MTEIILLGYLLIQFFGHFRLDDIKYEQVSDETLESLSEYLEELVASEAAPQDCDVLYSVSIEASRHPLLHSHVQGHCCTISLT